MRKTGVENGQEGAAWQEERGRHRVRGVGNIMNHRLTSSVYRPGHSGCSHVIGVWCNYMMELPLNYRVSPNTGRKLEFHPHRKETCKR